MYIEKERYNWLQVARALAACGVMMRHFFPQFERYGLDDVFRPFILPFWNVDIFFILSGFIMALSVQRLQKNNQTDIRHAIEFIGKRLIRIFTGYWPVLALSVWAGLHSNLWQANMWTNIFVLTPVLSSYTLGVVWTLHYELMFYVYVFLLLFLPASKRLKIIMLFLLLVIVWNFFFYRHVCVVDWTRCQDAPGESFFSAFFIEFIAGILLYRARRWIQWNPLFSLLLMVMIVLFYRIGSSDAVYWLSNLLRVSTFGVSAMCFVVICLQCEQRFQAPKFLVKIGDASYAQYLLHGLIFECVVVQVNNRLGLLTPWGEFIILSLPVAVLIIAYFWHNFIMQPLYHTGRRWLHALIFKS